MTIYQYENYVMTGKSYLMLYRLTGERHYYLKAIEIYNILVYSENRMAA